MRRAETALRAMGVGDDAFKQLDAEIEAEVEDAVRFADESPEPGEELIEAFNYA